MRPWCSLRCAGAEWHSQVHACSRLLSHSFGTSSEVSSWEGGGSADRHLLALKFWDTCRVVLPGFTRGHFFLTRNGPKVPLQGGPPTHVVHSDRSFDHHDADLVFFGVTAEEIRWQSGVVVPHVTVRPLRRRRHLRRERCSRTRHCGVPVLSSVRPSVLWAFTETCRLWPLAQEWSGMSLAVRGTTCVAPGQLGVDAPSSSPVCARLHRFLFEEDRTAVHEAGSAS